MRKTALILGAGGFIASHMVNKLKDEGYWVRAVDLRYPKYSESKADEFVIGDLTDPLVVKSIFEDIEFDEVIQMAADMGGMGYLATGENDANVMHNSALINLNVAYFASKYKAKLLFYSSSACIYPMELQGDENIGGLKEHTSVPAHPDMCYGWEKLFSEILYDAFRRNYGLNIRVARFHNVFGEDTAWNDITAKAPASLCRKVAMAKDGDEIEVWGNGNQTRSFLYISEAVEGVRRLMASDFTEPINIGSDEKVTINQLAQMIIDISGKKLTIKNIQSNAVGVNGRNSDNDLIKEKLNWSPSMPLKKGIDRMYDWVNKQVNK